MLPILQYQLPLSGRLTKMFYWKYSLSLSACDVLFVALLVIERYSLRIIRIVSGIESKKRLFRSSSNILCISCVTVTVYLRVNNSFTNINSYPNNAKVHTQPFIDGEDHTETRRDAQSRQKSIPIRPNEPLFMHIDHEENSQYACRSF